MKPFTEHGASAEHSSSSAASTVFFAASLLVYGFFCEQLALGRLSHRGWAVVGARYLILLPAVIFFLRFHRGTGIRHRVPLPRIGISLAAFFTVALLLSWQGKEGITISDESAYRFQARIFAAGRLWAVPLPGADRSGPLPAPIRFTHHVFARGHWFAKYPPGWPLLLSLAERAHLAWVVNPLLATALLLLVFAIGKEIFDEDSARLATLLAVLSPYFWAYGSGYMSHASCGVLVAGASLALLRALRLSSPWWALIGFLLLVYACLVRPLTGIVCVCWILAFGLWSARDQLGMRRHILGAGIVGIALAVGLTLAYNKIYTGAYWLSPYALSRGLNTPKEISVSPTLILHNFVILTRWALQNTLVYTFPFLFLLAAYAALRDWSTKHNLRLLAGFFPVLVAAHLIQTETSASFVGERYYFEAFFAVVILAGRGVTLLFANWKASKMAVVAMVAGFTLLQIWHITLAEILIRQRRTLYIQAASLAETLPNRPYVVFFAGPDDDASKFIPKHFNRNGADWEREEHVFMVDPGVDLRELWTRRAGRRDWAVIRSYENKGVRVEQFGTVDEATLQPTLDFSK